MAVHRPRRAVNAHLFRYDVRDGAFRQGSGTMPKRVMGDRIAKISATEKTGPDCPGRTSAWIIARVRRTATPARWPHRTAGRRSGVLIWCGKDGETLPQ